MHTYISFSFNYVPHSLGYKDVERRLLVSRTIDLS